MPCRLAAGLVTERGAAWLAHQSGGLGVVGSNPAAPTNNPAETLETIPRNNGRFKHGTRTDGPQSAFGGTKTPEKSPNGIHETFSSRGPRYAIIPPGAVHDPQLTLTALRLLCYLGYHTNSLGWCRIRQKRIAQELGIARSTVQVNLDLLYCRGWVEKRHEGRAHVEPDPNGQPFAPHSYRVRIDRPETSDGEVPGEPGTPSVPDRKSGTGCASKLGHQERFTSNEIERTHGSTLKSCKPPVETFLAAWPTAAIDDRQRTEEEWSRLSISEREAALAGIEPFQKELKSRKRNCPPAGWKYLSERRWSLLPIVAHRSKTSSTTSTVPWCGHPAGVKLLKELGASTFDAMLGTCRLEEFQNEVVLYAPSVLFRDLIGQRYITKLERAFAGKHVRIEFAKP
jgi:hypothetical protein